MGTLPWGGEVSAHLQGRPAPLWLLFSGTRIFIESPAVAGGDPDRKSTLGLPTPRSLELGWGGQRGKQRAWLRHDTEVQ